MNVFCANLLFVLLSLFLLLLLPIGPKPSESKKIKVKIKKKIVRKTSMNIIDVMETTHQSLENESKIDFNLDSLIAIKELTNSYISNYFQFQNSIPGYPGIDYPILNTIPYTNFYCDEQPFPGYFADLETGCQTWHYCDIDGRQSTFLCPNGTVFNQAVFTCDWWFNVDCSLSEKLYAINIRLYGKAKKSPKIMQYHHRVTKELLKSIFNN